MLDLDRSDVGFQHSSRTVLTPNSDAGWGQGELGQNTTTLLASDGGAVSRQEYKGGRDVVKEQEDDPGPGEQQVC